MQALEGKVLEPVLRQGREPGPVRVPALEPVSAAWLLRREPGRE